MVVLAEFQRAEKTVMSKNEYYFDLKTKKFRFINMHKYVQETDKSSGEVRFLLAIFKIKLRAKN